MLNQTLKSLKSSIHDLVDQETEGIEDAYGKLEEGESLSISFSSKITPPKEGSPDIDLQVGISYVVERRKAMKSLRINEDQMEMEFGEGQEDIDEDQEKTYIDREDIGEDRKDIGKEEKKTADVSNEGTDDVSKENTANVSNESTADVSNEIADPQSDPD